MFELGIKLSPQDKHVSFLTKTPVCHALITLMCIGKKFDRMKEYVNINFMHSLQELHKEHESLESLLLEILSNIYDTLKYND